MNDEGAIERKQFGARLRALRKEQGISAAQVEIETGISRKRLCRYESGTMYPTWGIYIRLHNFFGGGGFPQYRPITAGIKEIPLTDAVLNELDELTKTRSFKEMARGCRISEGGNLYRLMCGNIRRVRRQTLQNIFDYLSWGAISDEKMGEYPTA